MPIRTTQKLMCKLTQMEIDERSVKAAELDQEKRKLADEKKGRVKIFNEQLKHLDKQIAELTEQATTGEELREIECEERPGLVNGVNGIEVWRLDTNELIDSWTEDPEDDAPDGDKQPGLPFAAPEVPRLLCTAIDADGECHEISAEQADAGELEINDSGIARLTIGERTVVAVRIARGKPCETCGVVGGDHRPECADLKKADAVIDGEGDGKSIDEIADEVADALEEYDRNDTAQVAAKIDEIEPPPDGPVRGVESATTKVKPKRGKRGAAGAEAE